MPIPTPSSSESRDEFISRCMGDRVMTSEYPNTDQRLAICSNQWQERSMSASTNDKLLDLIRDRQQKQTEFGYGILTADRYVRTVKECVGLDACYKYAACQRTSFQDVLDKSGKTLVYSNPEMVLEGRAAKCAITPGEENRILRSDSTGLVFVDHGEKQTESEIELPNNTLMVFRHVLTSPRKDRDGDILRTEGAEVDPKMLLLWQHVHTLPIGKMLSIAEHTSERLSLISAIVDMNELCHDAAVMIDSGMGRFSHGFRALEFDKLKEDEGETTSPGGFDVKRFEIMEASLVSVPSNVDAETEEVLLSLVEGGKLTSPLMKEVGKTIRDKQPVKVTFIDPKAVLVEPAPVQTLEINDENKPGDREGKGAGTKEGCTCAPTKEDGETSETKQAGNPEISEKFHGLLQGSWEWVEAELRSKSRRYLVAQGISVGERDWTYLVGTFADHTVVCVEKPESGVVDEFRYFKIGWEVRDDLPEFKGDPEQVDIVVSTELRERSPGFESKQPEAEKAGRTLSARNLRALEEVKADLEELAEKEDMSRGGGALCHRCINKLAEIIEAGGGGSDDETSAEVTVKQAMAQVIAEANSEERTLLKSLLDTELVLEESRALAKQFSAIRSA